MAELLAQLGHTVYGCGRSREAIADLRESFASPHHFAVVDVSLDEQVQAWAGLLLDDTGPPDLVVNNAGVINENAPLWEVSAQEMATVLRVNVEGPANVIRAFLPAMIEAGRGVVVNISSGWGRSAAPQVAPYCTSKWAIEGLTRALAQELPKGLAAVAVNPGVIDTDMLRTCWAEAASGFPNPEVWAVRAVPFLLSLGPEHNGQALSVS
jgi:NAD(P)-dependent dehydrogenase (short-subunit alcohol dehydrogenase family)